MAFDELMIVWVLINFIPQQLSEVWAPFAPETLSKAI